MAITVYLHVAGEKQMLSAHLAAHTNENVIDLPVLGERRLWFAGCSFYGLLF